MIFERRCDLHVHTTESDGTFSPAAVVRLAKEAGISCLAITDHDTVGGVAEAQAEGNQIGVEVISGVEISAQFEPGTMHILGYFIDWNSDALKTKLSIIQEARRQRNPQIIDKLRSSGIDISLEDVAREAGGDLIGRPHFASVLVKKGYVKDFDDAFDRYLGKDKPAYVHKRKFASEEAIQMIDQAGGMAVLAHPKQLRLDSGSKALETEIEKLRSQGLAGIEIYSSCQNSEEAKSYGDIAQRLGLFTTGGSDFHGFNRSDIPLGWMGEGVSLSYHVVDRMKQIVLDRKMS